jgi:predicted branched-subunit amino acid permease
VQSPTSKAAILRDAVGIGIGVASYGVSFGALGVTSGLDLWQTQALSSLMFTGASQFALVGVLGAGGSALSAIAAALLLGFRNFPYALRMSSLVKPVGVSKLIAAQLTIDESTAMGLAHEKGPDEAIGGRYAFWATGISVFVFWNAATLLGAIAASGAGDPKVFGLDAAIAAGFVALVWPQFQGSLERRTAALAFLVGLAAISFVRPGLPILLAGAVALVIGLTSKPSVAS